MSRTAENGAILLAGGQGSRRRVVSIEGPDLAAWIIGLAGPESAEELEQALVEVAGDAHSARELLAVLVDCGVLVDPEEAAGLAAKGAHWESLGWRDAFDFHYSGTGSRFYWTSDAAELEADIQRFIRDSEDLGLPPQPGPFPEPGDGTPVPLKPSLANYPQSGSVSMTDVLLHRGASDPPRGTLRLAELAHLLKHSFGVQRTTQSHWGDVLLKTYPSGGARHPFELYVAACDVEDLDPGIYHYDLRADSLVVVRPGDRVAFPDEDLRSAPAVLLVTCRWLRNTWKYRYSRNYRMILLELGHLAETIRLVAFALGLDARAKASFDHHLAAELLDLPDDLIEGPLLVAGVGRDGLE